MRPKQSSNSFYFVHNFFVCVTQKRDVELFIGQMHFLVCCQECKIRLSCHTKRYCLCNRGVQHRGGAINDLDQSVIIFLKTFGIIFIIIINDVICHHYHHLSSSSSSFFPLKCHFSESNKRLYPTLSVSIMENRLRHARGPVHYIKSVTYIGIVRIHERFLHHTQSYFAPKWQIPLLSQGILFRALFKLFVWCHNCKDTFTIAAT